METLELTTGDGQMLRWEALKPAPDVGLEEVLWRIDSKGFERPSSITGFVARYVPYLNAAVIARLMDRWVGPANWRDLYEAGTLADRPVLWCHVEVRDPMTSEWIRKSDAGVAPGTSGASGRGEGMAEKGIVSDAFKRAACLKWGAGRNVYDLPTVWGPVHLRNNDPDKPTAPAGVEAHLIAGLRAQGLEVDQARTDIGDVTDLSPEAPAGPQEPAHACPHCGSPVLDQRKLAEADIQHKAPAWKCRNAQCNGGSARKTPRPGDTENWPWASWDKDEFTPPVEERERATWDAKRRILERAGGDKDYARQAWKEAASDIGKGPDDALSVDELDAVELHAGELLLELASIAKDGQELPEGKGELPETEDAATLVEQAAEDAAHEQREYAPGEEPF